MSQSRVADWDSDRITGVPDLSTTDTKKKLTVGVNIVNYLKDENNPLDCEDIGGFIDGLVPWMQSSNFKVRFGNC